MTGINHTFLQDQARLSELIKIEQINGAYERMLKSDVNYRLVIDIDSLRA